jgi:hypothetical protein
VHYASMLRCWHLIWILVRGGMSQEEMEVNSTVGTEVGRGKWGSMMSFSHCTRGGVLVGGGR